MSEANHTVDPSFQLLVQQLNQAEGPQLLVADENLRAAPLNQLPTETTSLITNRYDLYLQAKLLGFNCYYNDFDFSSFPDHSFKQVLYRVSKEKPVTHHIINDTRRLIPNGGTLILSGAKTDGIKTYTEKAANYFGSRATAKKHGNSYCATIPLLSSVESALDDKCYSQLRPCISLDHVQLHSKPGLFGWNKIDQGSAFLAEHLSDFFKCFDEAPEHLLDLGCGYGYLSVMAHRHTKASITATDNNAAAITACSKNFSLVGIKGETIAADCAEGIDQEFDAIICNPPFHQGFSTNRSLTQRFVDSCHRHLRAGSMALFVINRFVPLESCAENLFQISPFGENKSFKLVLLKKP